ncbi:thymidine kinase 2-like isoform X2 [Leptotrombidium deliense]|uniref:Thymidine kinase 2-like isoform X2 n=1 Tax=Leptotrombidium deliense TaxID=299467 RepID=A0A443RTI7_9ACAR|nr:thymidine kinase 2-like isoform X2 [Leptotrombidium deliense]
MLYDPYVNVIVYLRSEPSYCMKRIHARGRAEEVNVCESFLRSIHDYHELWINKLKKVATNIKEFKVNKEFLRIHESSHIKCNTTTCMCFNTMECEKPFIDKRNISKLLIFDISELGEQNQIDIAALRAIASICLQEVFRYQELVKKSQELK